MGIRLVEALNYRCLKYIRQPLGPFNILVGPNGSGKSTFFDVFEFLGDFVNEGLEAALVSRSDNFSELLWNNQGSYFELAVELEILEERKQHLTEDSFNTIRYEVKIGIESNSQTPQVVEENLLLKDWNPHQAPQRTFFPEDAQPPSSIITPKTDRQKKIVASKSKDGKVHFYAEVRQKKEKGWFPTVNLGLMKSALANLHEDESKFPVSTWFKNIITDRVQKLTLDSLELKRPSSPYFQNIFKESGSNLPHMINMLMTDEKMFRYWIEHLKTALSDIENIRTIEREEDKTRYLKILYNNGIEVPSWFVSDGTLRLLALTIIAYLPSFSGIYLIEEPENGIHPQAMEAVYQSLSSAYNAQILLATHSPVILSLAKPKEVLCFSKTESGATDIVRGDLHPRLKEWRGDPNFSDYFVSGVLS